MSSWLDTVCLPQEGMPVAGQSTRRGLEVEEIEPGDSVRHSALCGWAPSCQIGAGAGASARARRISDTSGYLAPAARATTLLGLEITLWCLRLAPTPCPHTAAHKVVP